MFFFVFTVMRLTKPTLMPYHPLISDQRDVTSTLSHEVTQADISKPDDLSYFGVSDLLTLPQNFGYALCFMQKSSLIYTEAGGAMLSKLVRMFLLIFFPFCLVVMRDPVPGHHSFFRKGFQLLLVVNGDEIWSYIAKKIISQPKK